MIEQEVVISSISSDWNYISYIPIFIAMNKKFGTKVDVAFSDVTLIELLSGFESENIKFTYIDPLMGIDSRVQSKINRILLAQDKKYHGKRIIICDIDMVNLNDTFLRIIRQYSPEKLIKWGYDHPSYLISPDLGKWAMDKSSTSNSNMRLIFNPNDLSPQELILEWKSKAIDERSNPFNNSKNFSDESLFKDLYLYIEETVEDVQISRAQIGDPNLKRRLDRSYNTDTIIARVCFKIGIIFTYIKLQNLYKYFFMKPLEYHGFRPFENGGILAKLILRQYQVSLKEYNFFKREYKRLLKCQLL